MRSRGNSTSSYVPANWTSKIAHGEIAASWIEAYQKYVAKKALHPNSPRDKDRARNLYT
jgi:hypothetical protein